MDQKQLNVLMSEPVLRRTWKDFKKYLTRWWFALAQIFLGAIAYFFGEPKALLINLLLCLVLFILASVLAPWRQRDELRQAFNVAAPIYDVAAWSSLEKEFRSIKDVTVMVHWENREGYPKEWNVWGDGELRFTPLAERAGNMLPRTPHSGDFVAADVLAETNPLWRWLCLLATDGTKAETTGDGSERDNQGNEVSSQSGGVRNPQERSANMCAQIAAKIA